MDGSLVNVPNIDAVLLNLLDDELLDLSDRVLSNTYQMQHIDPQRSTKIQTSIEA